MSNPNRKPYQTLGQALEELEREDPAVAKAAQALDELPAELHRRDRFLEIRKKHRGYY